jgi:hypothetical protein
MASKKAKTKAKSKASRAYGSARRGAERAADSKQAHQIRTKVTETAKSIEAGAKRVDESQEVKDAGSALMRDAGEFASAIYNAARGKKAEVAASPQDEPKKTARSSKPNPAGRKRTP